MKQISRRRALAAGLGMIAGLAGAGLAWPRGAPIVQARGVADGSRIRQGASWQVSAPREPLPVNTVKIELGLRNKFGEPGELYDVTCWVVLPTGGSTQASTTLSADEWAYVLYPNDFEPHEVWPSTEAPGRYSVAWEVDGTEVASDSFDLR